mmetsp:Transcript_17535/g.41289  ORF Transcript_17535/g.41289 Transcript_17535/m.41289 type:complete len:131 (+) Transcript_17535:319-711(+)
MYTTTPGASITYTVDGSRPNENSAGYFGDFTLTKVGTTVVHAFAFKSTMDSEVTTATFILRTAPRSWLREDPRLGWVPFSQEECSKLTVAQDAGQTEVILIRGHDTFSVRLDFLTIIDVQRQTRQSIAVQ